MNQLPHDALARTTIHAPPRWQALQKQRQRRRYARRAAALMMFGALIIAAPGLDWWDLERAANALAAIILVPASFACCELIERLIFCAANSIKPGASRRLTAPPSGPVSGRLTITHDATRRGGIEQLDPARGLLTLSQRAEP